MPSSDLGERKNEFSATNVTNGWVSGLPEFREGRAVFAKMFVLFSKAGQNSFELSCYLLLLGADPSAADKLCRIAGVDFEIGNALRYNSTRGGDCTFA